MLASSGCTGANSEPDRSATSSANAIEATAAPASIDPTIPVTPSLPAGIPTADPPPKATPDPTTLDASVLITLATVDPDSGGLLLGGYVSGVVEDGGDCQYVITPNNGDSMTIHKDGVENNGSTSCGSTTVAKSLVPAGTYTVILRYANDAGQVSSEAVEVAIP